MKPTPDKLTVFIFALMLFWGCEKPIQNFDLKDHDPKIVANAILSLDSIASIHISKSKDLLDSPNSTSLMHATSVYLYVEGDKKELSRTSDYMHQDPSIVIKEGARYTLEASAAGFKNISASVVIPHRPVFSTIDTSFKKTTYPGCFDCSPEYFFKTELKIEDDVSSTDFYQVELLLVYEIPGKEGKSIASSFEAVTTSPFVAFAGTDYYLYPTNLGGESSGSSFYFSDQSFRGKTISIAFYAETYSFYNGSFPGAIWEEEVKEEPEPTIPELYVRLSRVSEDLFLHLNALASNNALGDMPLTEPVYIPTNIENGLGIFGAKASADTIIALDDVYKQLENITYEVDEYYYSD